MRWPPPSDWPNAEFSRQVFCAPHRWHVQEAGQGDTLLLLHGAGGSTQSFRALLPLLAKTHHVLALDLPGQGFTQLGARHRCGLDTMAEDIARLCTQEGWHPTALVGHSAGSAVALRLSETLCDAKGGVPAVVGINAALDRFDGLAGVTFPVIAKMLAALPFTAQFFSSSSATTPRIQSLIRSTGSDIGAQGIELYRRLVADRNHVDATLLMMAQWSLDGLLADLPSVKARTLLIIGDHDGTVPPAVSTRAAARLPDATLAQIDAGHLAHEEHPEEVARLITGFLAV